jgi:hypothetical protein
MPQKIESAFSRIMNGNFSHGTAYWEGNGLNILVAGQPSGPGPTRPDSPRYTLQAPGRFYHRIQYKDLSVYPAVSEFQSALMLPMLPERFWLQVQDASPATFPFAAEAYDRSAALPAPLGTPLRISQAGGIPAEGEYKLDAYSSAVYGFVSPVSAPTYKILEKDDGYSAFYAKVSGQQAWVKMSKGLDKGTRADGTSGIKVGDYFMSHSPLFGGKVLAIVGDRFLLYQQWPQYQGTVPVTDPSFPPSYDDLNWTLVRDWYFTEQFTGRMSRQLKAVRYDLTLAFTLYRTLNPPFDEIELQFYDENPTRQGPDGPLLKKFSAVPIDGSNPYFRVHLDDLWDRVVMRFVKEVDQPWNFGPAHLVFPDLGGGVDNKIGNVALFKGDYTDRFKEIDTGPDDAVFDELESSINAESEIIPKGTIIAYVGGDVCPPGFVRAEGIGRVDAPDLSDPDSLRSAAIPSSTWYSEASLDFREGEDKPRTILKFTEEEGFRPTVGAFREDQVTPRLVQVVPYRYPPDHPDHHLRDRFIIYRGIISDPLPVDVKDEYYRTDVVPGYVAEFRIPSKNFSFFAIITQFAQGKIVTRVVEQEPTNPIDDTEEREDDLRRAQRQVYHGANRNTVFRGYGIYGEFVQETEERVIVGLMGDLLYPLMDLAAQGAQMYIWKSGAIAHAANLPEIQGLAGLKDYFGAPLGGLSYFGEPHTHRLSRSRDIEIIDDVGNSGTVVTRRVPYLHDHGALFGAVTLPKARPILLCQKV